MLVSAYWDFVIHSFNLGRLVCASILLSNNYTVIFINAEVEELCYCILRCGK